MGYPWCSEASVVIILVIKDGGHGVTTNWTTIDNDIRQSWYFTEYGSDNMSLWVTINISNNNETPLTLCCFCPSLDLQHGRQSPITRTCPARLLLRLRVQLVAPVTSDPSPSSGCCYFTTSVSLSILTFLLLFFFRVQSTHLGIYFSSVNVIGISKKYFRKRVN